MTCTSIPCLRVRENPHQKHSNFPSACLYSLTTLSPSEPISTSHSRSTRPSSRASPPPFSWPHDWENSQSKTSAASMPRLTSNSPTFNTTSKTEAATKQSHHLPHPLDQNRPKGERRQDCFLGPTRRPCRPPCHLGQS